MLFDPDNGSFAYDSDRPVREIDDGQCVKISLATRHRQADTRQGLVCWREFEYLEKAKDRKTRAKKSYTTRTRAQLCTHSCYTQDKEYEGSKFKRFKEWDGSELRAFHRAEHDTPPAKKMRGKEEERKTRKKRIGGKKDQTS